MRVVVVGAQTYLGFHLIKAAYESGYEVTAADSFTTGPAGPQAYQDFFDGKVEVCDVRDYSELRAADFRADAIVNLLLYKSSDASPSGGERFTALHEAFDQLVGLATEKGVRALLNVSMAESIYGLGPIVPFDERALTLQPDLHGASALFAENFLAAAARRNRRLGKPAFHYACLRLSEVFGPALERGGRMPGTVGAWCETILAGSVPDAVAGRSRDLLYIEDAVAGIIACLKKLEEARIDDVFNVGSGVEVRDTELLQSLLRNFHEIASDPDAPTRARASLGLTLPATASSTDDRPQRFCLECTKFRAFFGWRPRHDIFRSLKTSVEESFAS